MAFGGEGIFTQHGPDGIFNSGGGTPNDASAPIIDSDGTPLRETLVVTYPSPGHMRVARARRNPTSGKVEMQEEERVPTPAEVEFLKNKGVVAGPGSMVTTQVSMPSLGASVDPATGMPAPGTLGPVGGAKSTIKTIAKVVAIGAVAIGGFYAVNRWVVPMVTGDSDQPRRRRARADDGDEDDDE